MICTKCGSLIPDDSVYCPVCGSNLMNNAAGQASGAQNGYGMQQGYPDGAAQYGAPQMQGGPQTYSGQSDAQNGYGAAQRYGAASGYGMPAGYGMPPQPPKKSKTPLIIALIAVLVLGAAAAVYFIFFHGKDEADPAGTTAAVSGTTEAPKTTEAEPPTTPEETTPEETTPEETTPEETTPEETTPEETTPEETTPEETTPEETTPEETTPEPTAEAETTPEAPEQTTEAPTKKAEEHTTFDSSQLGPATPEDFYWFYDVMSMTDLPEDAEKKTSAYDIVGKWKSYMVFYEEDGTPTVQGLGCFRIASKKGNVTLTVTPEQINYDQEGWQEDTVKPYKLTGTLEDGEIRVSGEMGNVILPEFFIWNGKQYAIGAMQLPSGEIEYIGLVRP